MERRPCSDREPSGRWRRARAGAAAFVAAGVAALASVAAVRPAAAEGDTSLRFFGTGRRPHRPGHDQARRPAHADRRRRRSHRRALAEGGGRRQPAAATAGRAAAPVTTGSTATSSSTGTSSTAATTATTASRSTAATAAPSASASRSVTAGPRSAAAPTWPTASGTTSRPPGPRPGRCSCSSTAGWRPRTRAPPVTSATATAASTDYQNDPYLVLGAEKHDAGSDYPSFHGWLDELRVSNVVRYSRGVRAARAPLRARRPDGGAVPLRRGHRHRAG